MKQAERDQFVSRRYTLAEWLCVPEYIMMETLQTGMLHADGPDIPEYGQCLGAGAKAHGSLVGVESRGRFVKEHDFLRDINNEILKLSQVVPDEIPSLDAWTTALVEWQKTCMDLMSTESIKKRKKRKQKLRYVPASLSVFPSYERIALTAFDEKAANHSSLYDLGQCNRSRHCPGAWPKHRSWLSRTQECRLRDEEYHRKAFRVVCTVDRPRLAK